MSGGKGGDDDLQLDSDHDEGENEQIAAAQMDWAEETYLTPAQLAARDKAKQAAERAAKQAAERAAKEAGLPPVPRRPQTAGVGRGSPAPAPLVVARSGGVVAGRGGGAAVRRPATGPPVRDPTGWVPQANAYGEAYNYVWKYWKLHQERLKLHPRPASRPNPIIAAIQPQPTHRPGFYCEYCLIWYSDKDEHNLTDDHIIARNLIKTRKNLDGMHAQNLKIRAAKAARAAREEIDKMPRKENLDDAGNAQILFSRTSVEVSSGGFLMASRLARLQ